MSYFETSNIGILMSLSFEHIHLISVDPNSTAQWYVEKLGGYVEKLGAKIISQYEVRRAL